MDDYLHWPMVERLRMMELADSRIDVTRCVDTSDPPGRMPTMLDLRVEGHHSRPVSNEPELPKATRPKPKVRSATVGQTAARVAELQRLGFRPMQIAKRLRRDVGTICYHLSRLGNPHRTRDRVRELTAKGLSAAAIGDALGIGTSAVQYHLRRLSRAKT